MFQNTNTMLENSNSKFQLWNDGLDKYNSTFTKEIRKETLEIWQNSIINKWVKNEKNFEKKYS